MLFPSDLSSSSASEGAIESKLLPPRRLDDRLSDVCESTNSFSAAKRSTLPLIEGMRIDFESNLWS